MANERILQVNDEFLVGIKKENQTYKTKFGELQHDIGLLAGSVAPDDPINGHIWVDTNEEPPVLKVYSLKDDKWYPIGDTITKDLQKDANGNVYIPGNLFINGTLNSNDTSKTSTNNPLNIIEEDETHSVHITGDVYVKGDVHYGTPYSGFVDAEDQVSEDNGDLIISGSTGHLVVGGTIFVNYTPIVL